MIVFDSSALLAFSRQEPGAQRVATHLLDGQVSAVNASEFVQKLDQYGDDGARALEVLERLGLKVQPVARADALSAAAIYDVGKPFGLSLGDRMCLALGQRLGAEILTADEVWLEVAEALELRITSVRSSHSI